MFDGLSITLNSSVPVGEDRIASHGSYQVPSSYRVYDRKLFESLCEGDVFLHDIANDLDISDFTSLLRRLRGLLVSWAVNVKYESEGASAEFAVLSEDFEFGPFEEHEKDTFDVSELSRFAFFRVDGNAVLIETAAQCARARLSMEAAQILFQCTDAENRLTLKKNLGRLFCVFGFTTAGFERRNASLKYWEFHDLLLHTASRLGRGVGDVGATFRFGRNSPEPPVRDSVEAISERFLPVQSNRSMGLARKSISELLLSRRSRRVFSGVPISDAHLGDFLLNTFRTVGFYRDQSNEYFRRVYPSGGGLYEIDVYVAVNRCRNVERGMHLYDSVAHQLKYIAKPSDDFEGLFIDAYYASGGHCWPQVLIVFASRFSRFSFKYQGMSYATQLKNVGVMMAHCYLIAEAMELSGTALGYGNASRFARVTNSDYYREGSIGEFALGMRGVGG